MKSQAVVRILAGISSPGTNPTPFSDFMRSYVMLSGQTPPVTVGDKMWPLPACITGQAIVGICSTIFKRRGGMCCKLRSHHFWTKTVEIRKLPEAPRRSR